MELYKQPPVQLGRLQRVSVNHMKVIFTYVANSGLTDAERIASALEDTRPRMFVESLEARSKIQHFP